MKSKETLCKINLANVN